MSFKGLLLLSFFLGLSLASGVEEDIFEDDLNNLKSLIRKSLVSLARNASKPQPRFGLSSPIDPLPAVAPLRYLHDGDLLKLRLLLTNVTLVGLSSLTVQEVSIDSQERFDIPPLEITPKSKNSVKNSKKSKGDTMIDPLSYEFLPELKDRTPIKNSDTTIIDDYDYYEDANYEDSPSSKEEEYEDNRNQENNHHSDIGSDIAAGDDEDYLEVLKREEMEDLELEEEEYGSGYGGDHSKIVHDEEDPQVTLLERKKAAKHRHNNKRSQSQNYDSFEKQFLKDYETIVERSRLERHKRSIKHYHHEDSDRGPSSRYQRGIRHMAGKPNHQHGRRHNRDSTIVEDSTLVEHPHAETSSRHQHHHKEKHREHHHSKKTADIYQNDEKSLLRKAVTLSANLRVSFANLRIKAQYVIKGRAGGVFTFKEQGRLVLTIPNVFLTSKFNVTLIPDMSGLRHWKNTRSHAKVQKVRSRMSLDTPKLELIPVSRPTEWVRKQLQEKMDELCKGVGRRDGAVRLLQSHWAKLLRRIVTKNIK